jgi:hypothetical protein
VVERRNMIMPIRGRACIETVRGSCFRGSFELFDFELFFALFLGLPLFVPFVDLMVFPSSR